MKTNGTARGELTQLISDIRIVIDPKNRFIRVIYLRLVAAKWVCILALIYDLFFTKQESTYTANLMKGEYFSFDKTSPFSAPLPRTR